jgi:hypothetical protein
MTAGYLKTFREAIRRTERREKSEVSELSHSPPIQEYRSDPLISHTSLNSPPVGDKTPDGNLPELASHSISTGREISEVSEISPFAEVFSSFERRRPAHVDQDRWQQAVEDGQRFLDTWGTQAVAFRWTAIELFGLHEPPENPHPSYNRMARYDCTGLVWLLGGNPVVALTENTAAIQHRTGAITVYRKERKPALGPVGDSLDDFV